MSSVGRMARHRLTPIALVLMLFLTACADGPGASPRQATAPAGTGLPRYRHVVVVVFENTSYSTVKAHAPYFMALADRGALMTRSHAVTHPSQPNYLALFAGSTFGKGDECPFRLRGRHLASQLLAHGDTFKAYSESLPTVGYRGCSGSDGQYRRKHAPWVSFRSFRQRLHKPLSAFPSRYSRLPTVSFVIPNMCHDMHDCSTAAGDRWLRKHLDGYARWAKKHHSLLIVTFDENDGSSGNHIYTALVGARISRGTYSRPINHFNMLRTLEDLFDLPALRKAADHRRITGIWR